MQAGGLPRHSLPPMPARMPTLLANPSRPVQVLHDGDWVSGWLEAYRHDPGGWVDMVR
jgi:hypothetical protein